MYVLQKVMITLFQILFGAAFYTKTNVTSRAWKAALNRNARAIGRRHSAVRICRLPSLFVIMFLDTLCSKKWYDMLHTGCGIHSLQRSTISRIGGHSAGYN